MSERPATVVLREVTDADLPVLYEHQADPEANRMAAFPARDREAFFTHWRTKVLANPGGIARVIEADGVVVGNIVAFPSEGEQWVGYWIARAHWGRGIASAALAEFLRVVAHRPLHAWVAEHNAGSARVLEKCGFVRSAERMDGTLRELKYTLSAR